VTNRGAVVEMCGGRRKGRGGGVGVEAGIPQDVSGGGVGGGRRGQCGGRTRERTAMRGGGRARTANVGCTGLFSCMYRVLFMYMEWVSFCVHMCWSFFMYTVALRGVRARTGNVGGVQVYFVVYRFLVYIGFFLCIWSGSLFVYIYVLVSFHIYSEARRGACTNCKCRLYRSIFLYVQGSFYVYGVGLFLCIYVLVSFHIYSDARRGACTNWKRGVYLSILLYIDFLYM